MPNRPKRVKPRTTNPARPTTRPHARDYNRLHQKLREQVLAERPFCEQCRNDFAVHAHHLRYPAVSVRDYMALCELCHIAVHAPYLPE